MRLIRRLLEPLADATVGLSYGAPGLALRAPDFEQGALDVDLSGRRAVVTGANAGLGRVVAEALAARGAEVLMLCRDPIRGAAARDAIAQAARHDAVHLVTLDVSRVGDVARWVREVRAAGRPVDILVNNAGVLLDQRQETPEGLEVTFATNVVGGVALTAGLRPLLAPGARVVNVTSGGMYTQRYDLDDPQFLGGQGTAPPRPQQELTRAQGPSSAPGEVAAGPSAPSELRHRADRFDGVRAYAQTKRGQVLLTGEWHRRLGASGVVVSAMHPGWAATPGVARSLPRFDRLMQPILRTPEQGADTAIWLAVARAAGDAGGGLYFDRARRREHVVPWTRSPEDTGARLLAYCRALIEARAPAAVFEGGWGD